MMRDPALELYDAACDMLVAAQRLRRVASRPGSDEALAATLGCLHEALAEVAEAGAGMVRNAPCGPAGSAVRDAVDRLAVALVAASDACDAARQAAAALTSAGTRPGTV